MPAALEQAPLAHDALPIDAPKPTAVCPAYRPEDIHSIIESIERYNPQNIEVLEEYVSAQLRDNAYDRAACLALLKLYQFNPSDANMYFICNILALALGALPDSDFNICLYMFREEWLQDPLVVHLLTLRDLLESAQFAEFWTYLEENEDALEDVSSNGCLVFDENVREFIASTLGITFQTIACDQLGPLLGLSGEDLDGWIKLRDGWAVNPQDSSLIDLPIGDWNQAKSVVIQEDVKFEQLSRILACSSSIA